MSVLAAAVALADLCRSVPVAVSPDPADSTAYTAVGDEARATDDPVAAAIAYRKAIELDPGNQRAAAGLSAVCQDDAAAALLDAIARYRAGDRAIAGAALSEIVRGNGSAAAGARLFLGLIALEHHDTTAAIRELELAGMDPQYRGLTAPLLRLAHRDGALAAALLIEPELDTNPQLVPDTPPTDAATGAPATDEDLLTVATITVRPVPWLAIRNTLTWRNQRGLSALDFIADDAELTAERSSGRHQVALRYDVDYDLLGGASYLIANRAAVAYRYDAAISPVASYAVRRRDYLEDAELPFTGWVHSADAGAVTPLGAGLELDARAALRRELTHDLSFSNLSAGLRVALRTRSTARVRLVASASGAYARYDAAQPDGRLRRDLPLEASADVEVDLGDHVVAVTGAAIAHNESSIEDFRYNQLIARCGLVVAWGGL